MLQGYVKQFNHQGVASFHYSTIFAEGFRSLNQDDDVSFDVELGPKGAQALKVLKLGLNNPVQQKRIGTNWQNRTGSISN